MMEKSSGMMLRGKVKMIGQYSDKIKLVVKQEGLSAIQKKSVLKPEEYP